MAQIDTAEPYASQISATVAGAEATVAGAGLQVANFTYTQVAAGQDDFSLVTLPAGKVRVYPTLSYISIPDMTASADFHLGHRAYTQSDGTAVAEDDNEWMDNVDSGGGAVAALWSGVTGFVSATILANEYDTVEGLTIFGMVDTANMDASDVLQGFVVWSRV